MIDLTLISGTYSEALSKKLDDIKVKFEDPEVSIKELKEFVLKVIESATDTPAKEYFVTSLTKLNNKTDVVSYVYGAVLKGAGLGVIKQRNRN